MLRFLRSAVCCVSLLLCVALTVLWVRGWWLADSIEFYRGSLDRHSRDGVRVTSGYGAVRVRWSRARLLDASGQIPIPFGEWHLGRRFTTRRRADRLPIQWRPWRYHATAPSYGRMDLPQYGGIVGSVFVFESFSLAHWVLVAVTAAPPALWWGVPAVRRRVRRRRGRCVVCGYDLRGGTGRCPECGTESFTVAGHRAAGGATTMASGTAA